MAAWAVTGILGRDPRARDAELPRTRERDQAGRGAAADRHGARPACRPLAADLRRRARLRADRRLGSRRDDRALLLAAAATVFVQIAEPLQAGFQATERMEYLAYSDIISKSGQGLVGIVVVLIGLRDDRRHRLLGGDDRARRPARPLLAARGRPPRPADECPAHGRDRKGERPVLGLRPLLHDLPLDRLRDAVAADDATRSSAGTRPDAALPDADVPAGRGRDRMAAALRPRVRRGRRQAQGRGAPARRARPSAQPPDRGAHGCRGRPGHPPAVRRGLRELGAGDGDPRALHPGDVHEHHAQPGPDRDEPPDDLDVGDGGDDDHQPAVQPRADPAHPAPLRQRSNRRGDQSPAHGDRGRGRGRLADRAEGLRRRHGAPDSARSSSAAAAAWAAAYATGGMVGWVGLARDRSARLRRCRGAPARLHGRRGRSSCATRSAAWRVACRCSGATPARPTTRSSP